MSGAVPHVPPHAFPPQAVPPQALPHLVPRAVPPHAVPPHAVPHAVSAMEAELSAVTEEEPSTCSASYGHTAPELCAAGQLARLEAADPERSSAAGQPGRSGATDPASQCG
eukprot:2722865-Prymnesium_polylepis.1